VQVKGQTIIWGLVFLLVSLAIFVGLQPVINDFITDALVVSDTLTAAVLRLMVPVVAIALLLGFLAFVLPQRQVA
jgi:hypothetical protein